LKLNTLLHLLLEPNEEKKEAVSKVKTASL